jgi:O-antigen/teichoic acid export membrane protein
MTFIGFLLLAWRVFGLRQSAPAAMALQGAAVFVAFLFGWVMLRRVLPSQVRPTVAQSRTREWLRLAIPLGLLSSIAVVLTQIDIILLGLLRNSTQVGLYSTSTRVASFVGIAEFAVNAAYLPVVARLFAANRIDRLRTGAPMVTLGAVLLSSVLAAPLIAFAPQVLRLFGSSFGSGAFILRVLCVTFLISAVAGQNGALLTMTKHVRPVMIGSGLALVTNIGLNLILIPLQAARGAAIAWLLSVIVWNGFLSLQVRRIYGFTAAPLALVPLLRRRIYDARRHVK